MKKSMFYWLKSVALALGPDDTAFIGLVSEWYASRTLSVDATRYEYVSRLSGISAVCML